MLRQASADVGAWADMAYPSTRPAPLKDAVANVAVIVDNNYVQSEVVVLI